MFIVSFLDECHAIVTLGANTIANLNSELVAWYANPENSFSENADNMVIYRLVQTSSGPKLEQIFDFHVNMIPQIVEG